MAVEKKNDLELWVTAGAVVSASLVLLAFGNKDGSRRMLVAAADGG
jgi:hypothetical protein